MHFHAFQETRFYCKIGFYNHVKSKYSAFWTCLERRGLKANARFVSAYIADSCIKGEGLYLSDAWFTRRQ